MIGPQQPEALAVIEARAAEIGAPLAGARPRLGRPRYRGRNHGRDRRAAPRSAAAAAGRRAPDRQCRTCDDGGAAADGGRAVERAAIGGGLQEARWPARLQRLTQGPLTELVPPGTTLWLDGGHNPAAGQVLAESLGTLARGRALHLVVGMLTTKDLGQFLAPLAPLAASLRFVPVPGDSPSHDPQASAATAGLLGARAAAAEFVHGRGPRDHCGGGAALRHPDLRLALPRRRGAAQPRLTGEERLGRERPGRLTMLFEDRRDAGRQLGLRLRKLGPDRPCGAGAAAGRRAGGGVEVAALLEAPLDLVLVRKIGAPGHEELAAGAVVDGAQPELVLNPDVIRSFRIDDAYLGGGAGPPAGRDRASSRALPSAADRDPGWPGGRRSWSTTGSRPAPPSARPCARFAGPGRRS